METKQTEKVSVWTDVHICDYHKKNPGKPYAGCTCSAEWSQKPRKEANSDGK